MIDKDKMNQITSFLIRKVFSDINILYNDNIRGEHEEDMDLIDVIASLHNLLYESVYGYRYDYMFHWANKEGSDCRDDIFDCMGEGDKE